MRRYFYGSIHLKNLKMKNLIVQFAIATIVFFALVTCKKNETLKIKPKTSFLKLNVSCNGIEVRTKSLLKAADVTQFGVEIYDNTNALVLSYARLSDVPDSVALSVGVYYVTVHSTNSTKAAFNNPCYFGQSNQFTIVAGQTNTVPVACYISNVKISVSYSNNIKSGFTNYSVIVYNLTDTLSFGKNDTTKLGYFLPGTLQVQATLTYKKSDGTYQDKVLKSTITNALASMYYELYIDASSVNGTSLIQVTAIDSMQKQVITVSDNQTTTPVVKTISQLSVGDLLITEVMANPDKVSDALGEWFEIYNNTSGGININGLVAKAGTATLTITLDSVLKAGAYAFFCRDIQGGAGAWLYYETGLTLVNSSGSLEILNSNQSLVICQMTYATAPTGASLSLDPTKYTAVLAQNPTSWCTATQEYSTGDKGTPGQPNPPCN